MNFTQQEALVDALNHFLSLLNQQDASQLNTQFNIDPNQYDELMEALMYGDVLSAKLTLAPKSHIFTLANDDRAIFDIFAMNTPEHYGIEACVYADEQETDLTLCGEWVYENERPKWIFLSFRV